MKKLLVVLLALVLMMPICALAQEQTTAKPKEFMVYTDKNARDNPIFLRVGWAITEMLN